jgi:predicted small lipoprotein YifL
VRKSGIDVPALEVSFNPNWQTISQNSYLTPITSKMLMKFMPMRRVLAPFLIALMLTMTACGQPKQPSRWDDAQKESTQKTKKPDSPTAPGQNLPKKPVEGGKLNQFFPASGNGYDRVFTQEKDGFAEAKLKKGGKELGMLSITDLASNPQGLDKYQKSTEKIASYPAVKVGNTQTAILVNNRYQVKAQSKDPSFSGTDRAEWIQKFNLSGLANLKK